MQAQRRLDDLLEGRVVGGDARARRQRDVEVATSSLVLADHIDAATTEGKELVLMQRDRQHVGVAQEDRLAAVPVMDIPVDHRDALDPSHVLQVANQHADVREQAEPHRVRRLGVMPGRAAQHVRVANRAREHGVGGHDAATCRERRDLEAVATERRAATRFASGVRARAAHRLDVLGRVHAQQLLLGRRSRANSLEAVFEAADRDEPGKSTLRLRALARPLGLEEGLTRVVEEIRPRARVVPAVQLLPDPSRRHRATLPAADHSITVNPRGTWERMRMPLGVISSVSM